MKEWIQRKVKEVDLRALAVDQLRSCMLRQVSLAENPNREHRIMAAGNIRGARGRNIRCGVPKNLDQGGHTLDDGIVGEEAQAVGAGQVPPPAPEVAEAAGQVRLVCTRHTPISAACMDANIAGNAAFLSRSGTR